MFYLRIKLICVWFKQVVRFISIKMFQLPYTYTGSRSPVISPIYPPAPFSPTFHDLFFTAFHELQTDLIAM